ncbi:hypothetical protein [Nocardia veterana]|uniref:Uncharacterized protein n=1 Tax=Nocardia veterana TaxID=132249 RepID=A0A7X6LXT9_9NOCA|nr:hypothetical protein [Nocardia veterana]NKY86533.1 hypothetical protein [Nocardia veterana]
MIALALLCLALAPAVYAVIVLWPQRIPKDRTVTAIRRRVESEVRTRHSRGDVYGG